MRRLLVHGLAGYTKGGIETFVLGMAEHMSDNIIFDYVIEKDGYNVKMPGNGDTIIIEPKRHIFGNIKSWVKLLSERKDKDCAVYFNWYSMAWLIPAIIARIKGYKVIIHAHNNNLHNCGIIQRTMHNINRHVQKHMEIQRLTNSELSARFFFGNKTAELIYNAIDTDKFAYNNTMRNKIRKELNIQEKKVYGFAGRLVYQKNPLFLINIFKEIQKRDGNSCFLVCGDGDLMPETKKKADEYGLDIIFVGSIKNIQDYYQAMDVFVLPSRFEGLGIVLIEAQCCGLPCVASADVIPYSVKMCELVNFIPLKNNPEDWAEKSIDLMNNERMNYYRIIQDSRYNINIESGYLEKVLLATIK